MKLRIRSRLAVASMSCTVIVRHLIAPRHNDQCDQNDGQDNADCHAHVPLLTYYIYCGLLHFTPDVTVSHH
jgi:hypothetical protein